MISDSADQPNAFSGDVVWSNTSYDSRWIVKINNVGKGGQGVGHKVISKDGTCTAFLKVMQEAGSTERRLRFHDEAQAYSALKCLQVPRLLESNAHLYEDKNISLYIVTDFIEGDTLDTWRSRIKNLSLDRAITIVLQLLDTIGQVHSAGLVHRDIKPQNIIINSDIDAVPVLVDFGIAFNFNIERDKAITRVNDGLGNKFLQLPELLSGVAGKRDKVSDLTFIAGILFYLITKRKPATLRDGNGKLPHQRSESLPHLRGFERSGILNFFDRAFSHDIDDRYQTSTEMIVDLHRVLARQLSQEPIDKKERLKRLLEDVQFRTNGEQSLKINEALSWAVRAYSTVAKRSSGNLTAQQTLINDAMIPGYVRLTWHLAGKYRISTFLWVAIIGSEYVWYTIKGEVYRASVTEPLSSDFPAAFIENAIDEDMLRILSEDPIDNPPEFSGMQAIIDRITYSWAGALELSETLGLPVALIIYDDSRPVTHREHLLDCVLNDEIVQQTIRKCFVLLIIKRSDVPEGISIPTEGDYFGLIEHGQLTEYVHIAANTEAARMRFSTLGKKYN